MLFQSFFKSLVEKKIVIKVELKNGIEIQGQLQNVDQNMNFFLSDVKMSDYEKYPQFIGMKTSFIRGSFVRYVHLLNQDVDVELLQDATLKELASEKNK